MADFGVEAGRGRDYGYEGVGVETVEDAACCDLVEDRVSRLTVYHSGGRGGRCMQRTYLAAADDENFLVLDLPGKNQAASSLDFGELFLLLSHICRVIFPRIDSHLGMPALAWRECVATRSMTRG